MLKTKNLVPSIYYDESRDFQFLGRTFDVVFNYLKTNIDLVKEFPLSNNSDDRMIPLLAKTLGFNVKHSYNTQDLKSICSVFADLLRNKGSKYAIDNACKTLMNSQNVGGYFNSKIITNTEDKHYIVELYVPSELKDTILLEDLFDYILPAGFEYRFIKSALADNSPTQVFGVDTSINQFKLSNDSVGRIAKPNDNILRPDMIADYNVTNTYEIGDIVKHDFKVYKAIAQTTGNWNPGDWEETQIATTFTGKIISGN